MTRPARPTGLGLIWAQSTAGVIGHGGRLPWHLPEDLAHFRRLTTGHPVIMGRRTWQSLPERSRPLPGRRNLVVSRQPGFHAPGAEVVGSVPEAVAVAATSGERAWVIGGAQTLAAARDLAPAPTADVAEVTEVDLDVPGDTFAPSLTGWTLERAGDWRTSTTGLRYRFLRYTRTPATDRGG
jgi:dihydrofolate reductase